MTRSYSVAFRADKSVLVELSQLSERVGTRWPKNMLALE